ncbi:RagB/SusD family nutrient uptake outer membrane protein [Sphingobacterium sp. UBA6645]|uniref:RagB/SusD family nutrient uptake outer membrane protein n=1 Tax=Sphingobacterium sp. UBA6645 TaxID=1947511 RepID=UPI0025E50360|nr:RagB/SusD family nutrient uptake outer membrane protein [Sphingobacterium sp. UBA6645]
MRTYKHLKQRNIAIFMMLVQLLLIGCSDDFLKPKPKSFFTGQNVFVNKQGYDAALITLRKNLRMEQTGQKNFLAHQWMASEAGSPYLPGSTDWRLLTPTVEGHQKFVSQINEMFVIVKNANTIISRIDNIEWEKESDRNEILAEALWHRSYWYYRLIGNYGDLPFVMEEAKGAKLDYKTHSRWAILEKIKKDMEWAVTNMKETGAAGVPTRGAGYHLLTKIYLANLEWDNAINAASNVINGPYSLMSERFGAEANDPKKNYIWDLHRPQNKNIAQNKETILAFIDRYEAPDAARSPGLFTARVYHPTWWHSAENARDKDGGLGFIDKGPLYDSLGRGNPDCLLNDWHAYDIWKDKQQHTWQNTPDLRRADINWFDRHEFIYNNPASSQYGKPFDPQNLPHPAEHFIRIYPIPFYKTYVPNHPQQTSPPMGSNGDWYIYRLAETFLLRAEAYYWKGNMTAAAEDINKVRGRAKAPLIGASDVSIDFIFDERARELFGEEPRQNELNRVSYIMAKLGLNGYSLTNLHEKNWFYDRISKLNNIYYNANLIISNTYHIEPYNFQWPIDDKIINSNTMGRINQNKGYVGAERNEEPLTVIDE